VRCQSVAAGLMCHRILGKHRQLSETNVINTDYCRAMADYNEWMNKRMYDVCAAMTTTERRLDRGAFFGSIHSTLNHILYGDLAFMSRFTGEPKHVPEIGVELYEEFDDLHAARSSLDQRILQWSTTLSADWLQQPLTYASKVDGVIRTVPRWLLVTHMFNHETHHRGQVSTLLSQMGIEFGSTDLPFMPKFQTPEYSGA